MCPPTLHPSLSLMALAGERTGRGWMQPNPELAPPNWADDGLRLLRIALGIALFLVWASILQGQGA